MDDILNLIFGGNVKTISKTFTKTFFDTDHITIKINEVNKFLDSMVQYHTSTLVQEYTSTLAGTPTSNTRVFITSQNQTMLHFKADLTTSTGPTIVVSRVVTFLVISRS